MMESIEGAFYLRAADDDGVHPVLAGVKEIREAVEEFKPHVVFNLLEQFHGETAYDQNVASYLELLRMRQDLPAEAHEQMQHEEHQALCFHDWMGQQI